MALLSTPAGDLGSLCPDFTLLGVDGREHARQDFENSKALVVMFICNHCPYVQAVEDRIVKLAGEMMRKQIAFVGISANDATKYPEDSFAKMRERAAEKKYPFAYLYDESQEVARRFGAVCTPDFFVYDQAQRIFYRGRLDDSWKDPAGVTRQDLREALNLLLEGQKPPDAQMPSMGCSIKWKEHS